VQKWAADFHGRAFPLLARSVFYANAGAAQACPLRVVYLCSTSRLYDQVENRFRKARHSRFEPNGNTGRQKSIAAQTTCIDEGTIWAYHFAMAQIGRNDLCICGSRKKYKHCCLPLEQGRPQRQASVSSASTLQQKNLALIEATYGIFDLERSWDEVKSSISGAQIREFYEFIAALWPPSTNLLQLLPSSDSNLRALYLGEYEPELMVENVFRFCLYTDQVVLINPFENPNIMAEEFNPIVHPEEWKTETLRTIFHLMMMAPWIAKGFVTFIPNPGDFDPVLRKRTWDLAEKRLKDQPHTQKDVDASFMKQRMKRMLLSCPRDYVERTAREMDPSMSDDEIQRLADSIEEERAQDPFLTGETMDKMPAQMMAMRTGANLEMGMYICQATGAFPYTNMRFRWNEILGAKQQFDPTAEIWSPLTNAFQHLQFKFLDKVGPKFAYSMREDGRLEGFRSYLRKIWKAVDGQPDPSKARNLAIDFRDELTQSYNEAKAEWSKIDLDLLKWATPTVAGGLTLGLLSLGLPAAGFVVAGVGELLQAHMKRANFRRSVPMSVFIDLEEES
jgi:SEC-C motif